MSLTPSTHSDNCNFNYLSSLNFTTTEACEKIGKGICSSGRYVNMYKWYYCTLEQNDYLYFLFMVVFFLLMMYYLNFIRRQYYIQHIQNLRKILRLPDFLSESILVPVSYGIVPIFIRILSSFHKIDFSFQVGANIGACFNLITLFTGVCAMKIGISSTVNMPVFILNMVFVLLGNLLHFPLGSRKVLNYFDSSCYFILFALYLTFRWCLGRREEKIKENDSNEDLVESSAKIEKIESSYYGMRAIADFILKIDSDKRKEEIITLKKKLSEEPQIETPYKDDLQENSPPEELKTINEEIGRVQVGSKEALVEEPIVRPVMTPEMAINKDNRERMSDTMILFHRKINTLFLYICRRFEATPAILARHSISGSDPNTVKDIHDISLQSPEIAENTPDIAKDLPLGDVISPEQEAELEKFVLQFGSEFVVDSKSLTLADRVSIVEYSLQNRHLKSALVIGWEVGEVLYQNEYNLPYKKKTNLNKLIAVLYWPVEIFSNLTILPHLTEEDDPLVSKLRLLFNPLFTSCFLAYVITHGADYRSYLFLIILGVSFLINAVIIYPVVVGDKRPNKAFFGLIFINNVLMSLLFFYFISDIIVDIFRSLNVIYNFKYAFFTVSLFSMIIWIPAVMGALKTTELMKIVPGYNGAIFNTLLVFGFCVLIHQLLRGEITVHMWPLASDSQSDLATAFFLINSLVLPGTYIYLRNHGFRYTKEIGMFLTSLYLIVNGIVMLIGFFLVD